MAIELIVQRLFGIVLLVFALMGTGLVDWQPPAVSARAAPLRDAIFASGYIIPVVLIVYAACGLAFVANRFAPLAGVVLFPVALNILLFHCVLNPRSIPMALTVFAPSVFILWIHRAAYAPLLVPGPR